jgi:cellulose synthase/poly-beta-1,6-N-acetylglucosamine synthase-like glycosyltransferase
VKTATLLAWALTLVPLCLIGLHRLGLVVARLRMGRVDSPPPPRPIEAPGAPFVTIQLPLYNERRVARRVIEAAAAIRYPRERFEIQVLDDSTDETVDICRDTCEELTRGGVRCHYLHRTDRRGFKAGALAAGLDTAEGSLIAVFDADFVPPPDFLEVTVPQFSRPELGMVQARWDHLNRRESVLTRLQGLLLDGHFLLESAVRHRIGVFFNFNGTAGIWRRRAIDEAGGWSASTLTEDLDLSYRAQLVGWRFAFIESYTVEAEVPQRVRAFRTQQHRWTKGAVQVGGRLAGRVVRSRLPLRTKLEAMFHLYSNLAFPLVLLLSLLLPLSLLARQGLGSMDSFLWWGVDLPVLGMATIPMGLFYLAAEHANRSLGPMSFVRAPMAMALGLGMSVNNTRAVLEGLAGHPSEFVRTPKVGENAAGAPRYSSAITGSGAVEIGIAVYYAATVAWAASHGMLMAIPFLLLFLVGFAYVGLLTAFEPRS